MCCCVSKAEQCTLRCNVVIWGILAASSLQPIRGLVVHIHTMNTTTSRAREQHVHLTVRMPEKACAAMEDMRASDAEAVDESYSHAS